MVDRVNKIPFDVIGGINEIEQAEAEFAEQDERVANLGGVKPAIDQKRVLALSHRIGGLIAWGKRRCFGIPPVSYSEEEYQILSVALRALSAPVSDEMVEAASKAYWDHPLEKDPVEDDAMRAALEAALAVRSAG